MIVSHQYHKYIPDDLEEGILYISEQYSTAIHLCCCGCGEKVITPLKATGWELSFHENGASLYPSIGNWSFPCQSHYWIKEGGVEWSYKFSESEIRGVRESSLSTRVDYYRARKRHKSLMYKILVFFGFRKSCE